MVYLQPAGVQIPELERPLRPPAACQHGGFARAVDVDIEAVAGEVGAVDRTDRVLRT